jgi:tetratricopeptide (TPR) repeat protein
MSVISISLDNDYVSARQHCTEALHIAQAYGSLRLEMTSLVNLANCARAMSDYRVSKQDYEEAMNMARSLGYRWGEGAAQLELGDVVRLLGDYRLAQDLTKQALVILRDIGDYVQIANAYSFLARLCVYLGDYTRANEWLEQCWQTIRIVENPEVEVIGLWSLALLNQHTGHLTQALEHAEKAWQIALKSGYRVQQAGCLTLLGHVHASLAHELEATQAYEQAITIFAQIGNAYQVVEPQAGLAHMALAQGNLSLAQSHVDTILAVQANHPQAGWDEPFFAYLVCYRVLMTGNDPRAASVLEVACDLLQDYAAHIDDDGLRQSFLHNVPTHSELWALKHVKQAETIRAW